MQHFNMFHRSINNSNVRMKENNIYDRKSLRTVVGK